LVPCSMSATMDGLSFQRPGLSYRMRRTSKTDHHAFLRHEGALAALIRDFDWGKTALGPISKWPAHVKSLTSVALSSDLAMVMLWGPNGVMIYRLPAPELQSGS
jgi:hypothetical protein